MFRATTRLIRILTPPPIGTHRTRRALHTDLHPTMACTITSASALRARVAPASRVRARASAARTVATPVRASAERRAVEVAERSASRRAGALSASVAAAAAAPSLPALAAVQETAQVRSPPPRSPAPLPLSSDGARSYPLPHPDPSSPDTLPHPTHLVLRLPGGV